MNWFVFSLLSIFALASAELFQQRLLNARHALSERTGASLTFTLQSFFAFIIVLATPLRTPLSSVIDRSLFIRLLVVTLIGAIGSIFYFRSFKVKSISLSNIFISGSVIISTLLGGFFLRTDDTGKNNWNRVRPRSDRVYEYQKCLSGKKSSLWISGNCMFWNHVYLG